MQDAEPLFFIFFRIIKIVLTMIPSSLTLRPVFHRAFFTDDHHQAEMDRGDDSSFFARLS